MARRDRSRGSARPHADSWRKSLFDNVLRGIRLRSSIYFRPEFRGPWGIRVARDCAVFHIVEQGSCWLEMDGMAEPVGLAEGDFVVVTRGQAHTMRSGPGTPLIDFFDLVKTQTSGSKGAFRIGGSGALTKLVCGGMIFENQHSHPLLAILPPLLRVKPTEEGVRRLGLTTAHIRSELDSEEIGADEVATRLAEILFIHAVRSYFEENAETADSGWLAAVQDKQIGQALAILHSQPQRTWTVPALARRLAMSRSSFAARFRETVGEPPQRYFTRLRIHAAAVRLRTSADKLSAVAAAAGFKSVAAFAKSFKKLTGRTPGEYRRFDDLRQPPV
jgi:AraC-like DNA-binding protein/mannose-6-phosphate isomerase-like protein (cupin superfamily)